MIETNETVLSSILIQITTELWVKTMYKSVLYEIYNVIKLLDFRTYWTENTQIQLYCIWYMFYLGKYTYDFFSDYHFFSILTKWTPATCHLNFLPSPRAVIPRRSLFSWLCNSASLFCPFPGISWSSLSCWSTWNWTHSATKWSSASLSQIYARGSLAEVNYCTSCFRSWIKIKFLAFCDSASLWQWR